MTVVCVYCSNEVEESFSFRRVTGWERKASADSRRGGSDIVLRESMHEFACFACITRLKSGVNVDQQALV